MNDVPRELPPVRMPVLPRGVYAPSRDMLITPWQEIVADWKADPGDVVLSHLYLAQHPAFWQITYPRAGGDRRLRTGAAWYGPIETTVWRDPDDSNQVKIWMEATPQLWPTDPSPEALDLPAPTSAASQPTWEQAVRSLAMAVHLNWGDDRSFLAVKGDGQMTKPKDMQCYHCTLTHVPSSLPDHQVPCNLGGCPAPNTHAHCCHIPTIQRLEDAGEL